MHACVRVYARVCAARVCRPPPSLTIHAPPATKLAGTQWEYGTSVDPERFKQTDKVQSTIMDPPKGGVGLQRALTKQEMFGMMQKFKYGECRVACPVPAWLRSNYRILLITGAKAAFVGVVYTHNGACFMW